MSGSITNAMLAAAALRALRHWLFELGHKNATIGSATAGLPDVYHLLNVGRVVHVKTAITPSYPESLTRTEIRALRGLARRLDARAWEAQVILRPNYHPSAILWRDVEARGKTGCASGLRGHVACRVLAAG
jgi:hypothetical protein